MFVTSSSNAPPDTPPGVNVVCGANAAPGAATTGVDGVRPDRLGASPVLHAGVGAHTSGAVPCAATAAWADACQPWDGAASAACWAVWTGGCQTGVTGAGGACHVCSAGSNAGGVKTGASNVGARAGAAATGWNAS